MSYALETKKRKFERILESLTDGINSQSRTALNTKTDDLDRTTHPSSGSDFSKRRRITPTSTVQRLGIGSKPTLTTHYLPSSRVAFLERLETFRQITKWHIPSTSAINAASWAKRGWVCHDTDTVSCMNCKKRLHVDVDLGMSEHESYEQDKGYNDDPVVMANAVALGLVKRYQDMIISAHAELCPWRQRGCDGSIQRIEGLLNTPTALSGLEKRYESIIENNAQISEVLGLPSTEDLVVDEQVTDNLRFTSSENSLDINALRLAICGWQRKDEDIIECRHCFRSLGLWLYRGTEPTVESLDAIDSHLEYCPWRSEDAQDTKLSSSTAHKMPGWSLVYLAIAKKNNKGRALTWHNTYHDQEDESRQIPQPHLSPEQREKKMKDLVKRIKDLKKPFNVKALLRKKDKT